MQSVAFYKILFYFLKKQKNKIQMAMFWLQAYDNRCGKFYTFSDR